MVRPRTQGKTVDQKTQFPDVVVECYAPGFVVGASDLIIHTSAQGTYLTDPVAGRLRGQLGGFSQQMKEAYKIEQIEDDFTGQVIGVRYHYKGEGRKKAYTWRTRACHVTPEGITVPPLLGKKSDYPKNKIGEDQVDLLFIRFIYKSKKPGWVYSELGFED